MPSADGSARALSRRDALLLATAAGALGIALGAKAIEAGPAAEKVRGNVKMVLDFKTVTIKLFDAGTDPRAAPTVLQSLDLTKEFTAMKMDAGTAAKAASTTHTIKLQLSSVSADDKTTVVFEQEVVVEQKKQEDKGKDDAGMADPGMAAGPGK